MNPHASYAVTPFAGFSAALACARALVGAGAMGTAMVVGGGAVESPGVTGRAAVDPGVALAGVHSCGAVFAGELSS